MTQAVPPYPVAPQARATQPATVFQSQQDYLAQKAAGYPLPGGSILIDPITGTIVGFIDGNGNIQQPLAGVGSTIVLGIIRALNDPSGPKLEVDETMCWDINYWLSAAQIADARNPNGPTLNTTAAIQYAHDQLVAKFASEPTNKNGGFCGMLHFHNVYLVDGFQNWNQGICIKGDNMRDTIFLQSTNPGLWMFNVVAPQGRATDSHAPYWNCEDLAVFGNSHQLSGGALAGGIALPNGPNNGDAYGGVQMARTQIYGFSGNCLFMDVQRHAPKLRFCHFSAGGGVSLIGDGSDYASVVLINTRSDGEMLHCGAGGGNGHTIEINGCQTMQIKGGDYWSSAHAELGYNAFKITALDYLIIEGADVNGAVHYIGNANAANNTPPVAKSSQIRLVNINFRFRLASFGESQDGSGVPAPLDAYIILQHASNCESLGCTFTPYYDHGTKLVGARPRWLYSISGSETRHVARDHLPDIASNDWPAGADGSGNLITPTYQNSISNSNSQIALDISTLQEATGFHGPMVKWLNLMPGINSGIAGRLDGMAAPAGAVGEQMLAKLSSGSAVALTSGSAADIIGNSGTPTLVLTPGDWTLQGASVFVTTTTTTPQRTEACISTTDATVTNSDPTAYASREFNGSSSVGSGIAYDTLALGPTRIVVAPGTTQNVWLTGKGSWSVGGGASAYGFLRAARTV